MSNAIVRVSRPELTKEERKRRYAEIEAAAKKLLLATYTNIRKDDERV